MILYVHKKTVTYKDYGSFLARLEGLAWSATGKAQDASGFEIGSFASLLAAKRAKLAEELAKAGGTDVTIEEGEPIDRTHDINPHGLM